MTNYIFRMSLLLLAIVHCLMFAGCSITRQVVDLASDNITYKVWVVDPQGRPITAATIWMMIPGRDDHHKSPELMQRLLRRYAVDVDFIKPVELHPSLLVYYTDKEGHLQKQFDEGATADRTYIKTYFVALKRGYHSKFIVTNERVNRTHEIVITLTPDESVQVDPRMLEFDLLRAPVPGSMMSAERLKALDVTAKRMRALAKELEDSKLYDEASAVYFNLAHHPSVDTIRAPDGSEMVVGYTSGFSRTNPQRRADYDKAIMLNRSTPEMLLTRVLLEAKGTLYDPQNPSETRRMYIDKAEELRRASPERLWPKSLHALSFAYLTERLCKEACTTLQEAYQFEPEYMGINRWRDEFRSHSYSFRGCPPCDMP